MSKKLLVVPALLKAHIDTYTRKDGTVVQAHDDKRQAAAPDPHAHKVAAGWTKDHEDSVAVHVPPKGAKVTHPSIQGAGTVHSVAGNTVTVSHTKTVNGKKYPRLEEFHASKLSPHPASGGAKPAAVKPQNYADVQKVVDGIHAKHGHRMLRKKGGSWEHGAGPQLPASDVPSHIPEFTHKEVYGHDNQVAPWGPKSEWSNEFKAKGQHGFVLKHPSGKRSFVSSGGDGEMAYHHAPIDDSKPTGSAAPAKKVNVGSEKWPLHVKASEKLPAKHADGSTHHVGGFKPPEYPEGGGSTDGDVTLHHEGKTFSFTGKKGKRFATGEDAYEYSHNDGEAEHRAWVTRSGHLMND